MDKHTECCNSNFHNLHYVGKCVSIHGRTAVVPQPYVSKMVPSFCLRAYLLSAHVCLGNKCIVLPYMNNSITYGLLNESVSYEFES